MKPGPKPRARNFAREFRAGAGYVCIALAATALLHWTQVVRGYERANLDSLYVLAGGEPPSEKVIVVAITDDDYAQKFGGRSPLDRETVEKLIRGIGKAGAAVIGVDIFTEDWPDGTASALENEVKVPIVWIRDVAIESGPIVREKTLAGLRRDWGCQGPGVLFLTAGVAREYGSRVAIAGDQGVGSFTVPSFTRVIERVYDHHSNQSCAPREEGRGPETEKEFIPFLGPPPTHRRVSASAVMAGMGQDGWEKSALMKGRIVLLGGSFEASRDYYHTPFQERVYGVDIQADILAADLSRGSVGEAGWIMLMVIDAAIGLGLVAIGWLIGRPWILVATVGVVLLVSVGSVFLFEYLGFYLSFIPVLVGVAFHFLVEHVRDYRALVRENLRLAAENAALIPRSRTSSARTRRGRLT